MNRIKPLLKNLYGTENADDLMTKIRNVLNQTTGSPEVGKVYTFVYNPKTPNVEYDEFPLIACMELTSWGWKGFNFHWNKMRNYTFPEVVGELHEIYPGELESARALGYGSFKINS